MIIDENTRVLLTGATSKLGISLTKELIAKGAKLFATARNTKTLDDLKQTFPNSLETFACDLTIKKERDSLSSWIDKKNINLLIYNAGIGIYGPLHKNSVDENLEIIDVNIVAYTELVIPFISSVFEKKSKAIVLCISSATDKLIFPDFSLYSASKAYLTSVSKNLHHEYKSSGIKVLVASPGQIETDFKKNASKGYYMTSHKSAISPEKATKYLLKQLRKEKPYMCFPFWVNISRRLLKLFGDNFSASLMKKSIQKRYPS